MLRVNLPLILCVNILYLVSVESLHFSKVKHFHCCRELFRLAIPILHYFASAPGYTNDNPLQIHTQVPMWICVFYTFIYVGEGLLFSFSFQKMMKWYSYHTKLAKKEFYECNLIAKFYGFHKIYHDFMVLLCFALTFTSGFEFLFNYKSESFEKKRTKGVSEYRMKKSSLDYGFFFFSLDSIRVLPVPE